MAPRFMFLVLSIAFGAAVMFATITTVRYLSHPADATVVS
jgi:hypothetical protein